MRNMMNSHNPIRGSKQTLHYTPRKWPLAKGVAYFTNNYMTLRLDRSGVSLDETSHRAPLVRWPE